MALIVQKYGGTSMGSVERILGVAARVARWHEYGHKIVVVVSAMSGETNRLVNLARAISPNPNGREYDQMVATGEQVSIALLAMALQNLGIKAQSFTGAQAGIYTDDAYARARILHIDTTALEQLDTGTVAIVAGFQGVHDNAVRDTTTLGRGGSDTTAVALAAALGADECQIYTDVDGVYTTDPRLCPKAQKLDRISFDEMLEMASLGSKVLQIRSVEMAHKHQVPLRVLSSFVIDDDGAFDEDYRKNVGTLVAPHHQGEKLERVQISGIAASPDEAKISLNPTNPTALITHLNAKGIELDMLSIHDGTHFAIPSAQLDEVLALDDTARVVHGLAKLSVVGVGLRSHGEILSKTLGALDEIGARTYLISTSEIKISALIDGDKLSEAIGRLHTTLGLDRKDGISAVHGV